jgi:hypothetical protein
LQKIIRKFARRNWKLGEEKKDRKMNFLDDPAENKSGMYLSLLADEPGEGEAAMVLNSLVDERGKLNEEASDLIKAAAKRDLAEED